MYSFPNFEPVVSCFNCAFQKANKVVWYPHLFKNFPQFVLTKVLPKKKKCNKANGWIIEKAREFLENICFINDAKDLDCVDHNKLWKILKRDGNSRPPYLPPEKPVCRSRSNS